MRLFQNSGLMPGYRARLQKLTAESTTFTHLRDAFLADRFGAPHILKPILDRDANAFFTNGDDEQLQKAWAREKGMNKNTALEEILLAQIEDHRAEVFYNLDPVRYNSAFLRRLPGHVKHRIAWRAAPSGNADFRGYDLMLCNFPSILASFKRDGFQSAWFSPAHDPVMEDYATVTPRPVDITFIGTYSRHHRRRSAMIQAISELNDLYKVALHLDSSSRFLRLAESPVGLIGPLRKYRRPASVRHASLDPVFGRDLYRVIGKTRIVVNGAIDMSAHDRGNMRCWEAMGTGALLLTDKGSYPQGMVDCETMVTYGGVEDAIDKVHSLLADPEKTDRIAKQGQDMIRNRYSKQAQMDRFIDLVTGQGT